MVRKKRKFKRKFKVLILILILIVIGASLVSRELSKRIIRLKTNIEREIISAETDIKRMETDESEAFIALELEEERFAELATELGSANYGLNYGLNNGFNNGFEWTSYDGADPVTIPMEEIEEIKKIEFVRSQAKVFSLSDKAEAYSMKIEERKLVRDKKIKINEMKIAAKNYWKNFVDICKDITVVCAAIMAVLGVLCAFGFLPEGMSKRIVELKG